MMQRFNPGRWIATTLAFVFILAPFANWTAQAQSTGEGVLISLHADSTAATEILDILAERSGLNIVAGPAVQGRTITIHLRETPFEEALDLVVRTLGLGYERIGNSILVTDSRTLQEETGLKTRVFDIQYGSAVEIAKMLEIITKDVTADQTSNRVVIRATQAGIEQAAGIVEQMDTRPPQIMLEARLIEVNTTSLLEVGIDWEKITNWTGVITEGMSEPSAKGSLPGQIGYIKLDETLDYYRQLEAFEIAIDALVTDGNARLLANSKVVTLDGVPAEIFSGETVPVIITSLQSPGTTGGNVQTVQLEKIDVGVRLNIVPRLSDDGYITTLVEPEVSRIIAFVGPDDDLPQTTTRRATTLVRVKDGQKIFLGGLLMEEERKTVKKVPILGHLPLLGYLFQHTRKDDVRLDLLIEITPRVISE